MARQDLFGLRDIGLNLSTTQGDATSMAFTRDETVEAKQPVPLGVHTKRDDDMIGRRVALLSKKVTRYFPGQKPKWVSSTEPVAETFTSAKRAAPRRRAQAVVLRQAVEVNNVPDVDEDSDTSVENEAAPAAETAAEVAARRARVRDKLRHREPEPEVDDAPGPELDGDDALKPPPASSSSSSAPSSSEDEDEEEEESSEDEERPRFVPRGERATIEEAKEEQRREEERQQRAKARKEERIAESRALVAEVVTREESAQHLDDVDSDYGAPDDTDDLDNPLEFEEWRIRELSRANRDKDEREAAEKEAYETERRRNLTPAERAAEDAEIGKGYKPPKVKWKFLQKYHHKGAFFMDDDTLKDEKDVRRRGTDGAVGVDKFDRAALPSVLQVKDFGFAGRTKYTHLVDQDTTYIDRDNPFNGWVKRRAGDSLRAKYDAKMAGSGDLDRPFHQKSTKRRERR